MKYKFILIGIFLIYIIDVVGSVLSSKFNFPYSYFLPLSLIVYIVIPVLSYVNSNIKLGVLTGLILGFFDSTIGWKTSVFLGANSGIKNEDTTTTIWLIVVFINTSFATIVALISSWITFLIKKKKHQTLL